MTELCAMSKEPRSRERGPNRFSAAEVARGVRSVIAGGGKIRSVTIKPDAVIIECGEPDDKAEDIVGLLK
jgi:hypothetical protein